MLYLATLRGVCITPKCFLAPSLMCLKGKMTTSGTLWLLLTFVSLMCLSLCLLFWLRTQTALKTHGKTVQPCVSPHFRGNAPTWYNVSKRFARHGLYYVELWGFLFPSFFFFFRTLCRMKCWILWMSSPMYIVTIVRCVCTRSTLPFLGQHCLCLPYMTFLWCCWILLVIIWLRNFCACAHCGNLVVSFPWLCPYPGWVVYCNEFHRMSSAMSLPFLLPN